MGVCSLLRVGGGHLTSRRIAIRLRRFAQKIFAEEKNFETVAQLNRIHSRRVDGGGRGDSHGLAIFAQPHAQHSSGRAL